MTIINLKRYYPYMTEDVTLEVSDEIAAALSMGGRLCDSYKRQKRRNAECSLDSTPGFEDDVLHPLNETAKHFHLSESRAKSTEKLALDNFWLELPWWY